MRRLRRRELVLVVAVLGCIAVLGVFRMMLIYRRWGADLARLLPYAVIALSSGILILLVRALNTRRR